jgi:hypothetical protein
MSPLFVFAVTGTPHVRLVEMALPYLRKFSAYEIAVVQARSAVTAAHETVIEAAPPVGLNDHQASLWMKTRLRRILAENGLGGRPFCYLDSDVFALSQTINEIFDVPRRPIAFASDHASIDMFSHWAVRCGCRSLSCPHLREAMFCDFGVDVLAPDWVMWNGGVFTAGPEAMDVLDLWHNMTLRSFDLPYWRTRDQATLAAAAWRLGLQDAPRLPSRFNHVLDCHWGLVEELRGGAGVTELAIWPELDLDQAARAGEIAFVHFVNQGAGRRGWKHWDEVEMLLTQPLTWAA